MVVELHIGPDHAAGCEDLILAHAETPVLIDHLAEPHKEDAVEYAVARFENVCMKLSGLNHFRMTSLSTKTPGRLRVGSWKLSDRTSLCGEAELRGSWRSTCPTTVTVIGRRSLAGMWPDFLDGR